MLPPIKACVLGLFLASVCATSAQVAPSETFTPTWETQRHARNYLLSIPAPRGQITDRNGRSLAQNKVSYNLAVAFPSPPEWADAQALTYARSQIAIAETILGRKIDITDESIIRYYRNRALFPMEIAQKLTEPQIKAAKKEAGLAVTPVYLRTYPQGPLAGHVLGYVGKTGRTTDAPVQNNDLLWPEVEGRDGLELSFNDQLTGKNGQINIAYDASGKKSSERIAAAPQPGHNVVTTLDLNLQQLCEKALSKEATRGAIVIIEPRTGDLLAMASWPVFDPNAFVPSIASADFDRLNNDPSLPLLARAFRSAYPPGSAFKVFVGLAALASNTITPEDQFGCPGSYSIGKLIFRNWKKGDSGPMDFCQALTQSCNTWFYQVGIKTGPAIITDWCLQLGLGSRTGIPLAHETEGLIPTPDYMNKVHKRKFYDGDVANLSIGQGYSLISPLQMAQAMAAIANGGTLYQTRLVQQVQSFDNRIVAAYSVRPRNVLSVAPDVIKEINEAMVSVVENGTGGRASVPGIKVAGKTSTAQWGPKNKERTAAWFVGFAPADEPKYAFAVVYEGNPNDDEVRGGTYAAPLIGSVLNGVYKQEEKPKRKKKRDQ